jgi:hypothetical protein
MFTLLLMFSDVHIMPAQTIDYLVKMFVKQGLDIIAVIYRGTVLRGTAVDRVC